MTGDLTANAGMTKAIYGQIRAVMEPDLGDLSEDDLNAMRQSWKKLSYAIAKGIVEHIIANMEIHSIQTSGNINTTVSGETDQALGPPYNHGHSLINSSGVQNNVLFTQSNDGTGHVR
jgi:hypothetical protein